MRSYASSDNVLEDGRVVGLEHTQALRCFWRIDVVLGEQFLEARVDL